MDWPGLLRRYVWDADRTPYGVAVPELSPAQARHELFVYALLVAIAAGFAAILAAAEDRSPLLTGYALSVLAAAVALGISPSQPAAAWCAAAPAVTLVWTVAEAIAGRLPPAKAAVVAALALVWLGYARRVWRMTRRFTAAARRD